MKNDSSLPPPTELCPSVWILDDSPGEAEVIRRSLAGTCATETFTDGAVLIETLARRRPPDLLVLDWEMPGLSGIDVCHFLRSEPSTVTLPVLMLTANQRPEDVAEGLTAGANDYVFKPFNTLELSARVMALVRWDVLRKRAEQEAAEAHARTRRTLSDEYSRRVLAEGTLTEVQAAEEATRRSELRYRLATRVTRDVIWERDLLQDSMEWSVGIHSVFGHAEGAVPPSLGWWLGHIHPDDRERVTRGLDAALQGPAEEWQEEYRFQRGDGTHADVVDRGLIVRDGSGRAVQLIGAMQDITERKRAEAALRLSEERNRAVLTALGEGVTLIDARGELRMANASAERLLGLRFEQMVGRTAYDARWGAVHEDGSPMAGEDHPAMLTLRTGKPVTHRVMGVHRPDGTLVWLSLNAQPLFEADGQTLAGVVSSLSDITERKRQEEEARRRAEFERQLIGIVSHDLRTPLSAIILSASVLQRTDLSGQQARNVERIVSAGGRATRLIRDLLDFTQARLGAGIPLHPRAGDLHALARAAVDEVQPGYPERRIELVRAGDGDGTWDPDRISQVLSNLVGNALHYSPPGTTVRVETRSEGDTAVLQVHNQGTPIPPESLSRIFEPLERGMEQLEGNNRSIGLGLFIVRQIVRAHCGDIDVRSTQEQGTTFTVRLPRHVTQVCA